MFCTFASKAKLAVFTASDPGAAVKKSIDDGVNAVAVQRTVNGTTKTSVMEVNKRSAVSSVVATKTVGGQTQTATADMTSLPSTHSVILSVDDIDATAGLKANIFFKVVDGSGNVVTNGLSLPIEFNVPGTEAISSLDLYVYNTTTSTYDKTATINKKEGTTTTFTHIFTSNSDYQLRDSGGNIPCFTTGSMILTPSGYVAVEKIRNNDIVLTSDGRAVAVNALTTTVMTTKDTAPYLVPKHVFGLQQDLRLSPWHAFQIRKGVWMKPQTASELYDSVIQYDVGKTVTYYHLETPNYFKDNLVCNGVIVEAYAGNQLMGMKSRMYHYSSTLKGYTRLATPAPQRRLR